MTSFATIRDPKKDQLLTPENSALIMIDYQPVQVSSVASRDRRELVANATAVVRLAKLFGLPMVLSTVNVKTGHNAPTIHQITDVIPGVEAIDRTTINAWEDEDFVRAVKETGRRKLVVIALWTEACLAFPTLDALAEDFDVYPVIDAVGGTSLEAHDLAVQRIVHAGARLVSWVQLACELQRDWNRTRTAKEFAGILFAVEGR